MRWRSVRAQRSVDRGRAGWAIEPRNSNEVRGADASHVCGRQYRRRRYRESLADPARSENLGMYESSMRENRESRGRPRVLVMPRPGWFAGWQAGRGGPRGERLGGKPSMDDRGKSDGLVVPAKLPNKLGGPGAEVVEGRGPPRGTRPAKHAPDSVPGKACQVIWSACAEWRERTGMCGSPRSFTT